MNHNKTKAQKTSTKLHQLDTVASRKVDSKLSVKTKSSFYKSILENRLILILLIALIGSSVYFRTVGFDFTMDDVIYTKSNEAVSDGISRIGDIFSYGSLKFFIPQPINSGTYRPFTLLTFALEKQITGEFSPVTGHIINVILYFIVLVAAGIFLTKLLKLKGILPVIPLLILLLYALHPAHTEVVASIKSRDTLLSALLAFLSLNAFLNGIMHKKRGLLILSGLLFFTSLLSKEESLPLIAIAFFIPVFFLRKSPKEAFVSMLPFLISGIAYLILRFSLLDADKESLLSIVNNVVYKTEGIDRFMTNLNIWIHYVGILFWPFNLSYDYSFNQIPIIKSLNPSVIFSFLFFAALVVLSVVGYLRKSIIAFAIIFYLVSFSIFSNIIPQFTIGSTLAERFLFIPSLGFSILLVYGVWLLIQKLKVAKPVIMLITVLSPVLISYYAYSYTRTGVWKNNDSLFASGVVSSPDSWRTHLNLANHLFMKGRNYIEKNPGQPLPDSVTTLFADASVEFQKGINVYTGYVKVPGHYTDLGYCYLILKDTSNARISFSKEMQLYPDNNDPYYYLGIMAVDNKEYLKGINYLNKSLGLNSIKEEEILNKIAQAYVSLSDTVNARITYEKVLVKAPGNSEALFNMGLIAFGNSNYKKSIDFFNKSLAAGSVRQFDIYQNIARSNFKLNLIDDAITALESSLQFKEDMQTYGVLSFLYQQKGNSSKASYYASLAAKK